MTVLLMTVLLMTIRLMTIRLAPTRLPPCGTGAALHRGGRADAAAVPVCGGSDQPALTRQPALAADATGGGPPRLPT